MKFYVCKHCGNIITYVQDNGVKVKCCGEEMEEVMPNTSDGAKEKHLPVIKVLDNEIEISVGENIHPMTKEHLIDWIYIEMINGGGIVYLDYNNEPIIKLPKEEIINVYSHCNLHGLWKTNIK